MSAQNPLPNFVLDEFRSSSIPDSLTLANVQYVDGDAAVQILTETVIADYQRNTSYITVRAEKILRQYEFAAAGGWVAYGCNLEGTSSAEIAYFKPQAPRQKAGQGFEFASVVKTIKYETPKNLPADPIQPWVDDVTAAAIYQRFDVTPLEKETFWQTVKRSNLPIAITEGLKKALCLTAHGIPAIALRGIYNWHKKADKTALHSAIANFATEGRKIYIVFDQDEKQKTQKHVRTQIQDLGEALEGRGCKVLIPVWDGKQGKGIDDAIFGQGDQGQAWLDQLIDSALTLKGYKSVGRIPAALSLIKRLNSLSYPIERSTTGEYMPSLPPLQQGAIHVVTADMYAGKTTRIGADWVRSAVQPGMNVLVLAPLNSLGQQTANGWNLPHIHDYSTSPDQQQALWSEVSYKHGLVCCPDSLHRLPEWFFARPLLLILDEANQTLEHIVKGGTLGNRQAEIKLILTKVIRHAIETGSVVLSESGLPDRPVNLVRKLSGTETVRVFKHEKVAHPWESKVYKGAVDGFRALLLSQIGSGKHILYVTSSQQEGKRLEKAISRLFPERKVVRIDSETNQQGRFTSFFTNPDQWLLANQPDILILSPSAKSGISIEGGVSVENAYFSEVWAYFPALTTDTHMQLLGRYRPPVPRHIFCPEFIRGSGDESLFYPRAIERRLKGNSRVLTEIYGLLPFLETDNDRAELLATIEAACLSYYCDATAVAGAQKSIAREALIDCLESAGHQVTCENLAPDKSTSILWKGIQEAIWQEGATEIATTPIDPTIQNSEWALKMLNSLDASLEARTAAYKVLYREEFPGVAFDCPQECYEMLFKNYGKLRRGVLLHTKAENLEAAKEMDRKAAESILKGDIRALHRLPKDFVRATLIARTGILALLDGQTYHNADPRAIAVKTAALRWANEICYWFRLQIRDTQTPVEICNKLLKKLGLEGKAIARPGRRGEQHYLYSVEGLDNPIRIKLLEAHRRKLCSLVSVTRKIEDSDQLQIIDTPNKKPSELENWHSPEFLADVQQMWEAADSEDVRAAIRRIIPFEFLQRVIA